LRPDPPPEEPPSVARPWELRSWDGWWAPAATEEDEVAPSTAAVPITPPQPTPRRTAPQPRTAASSGTAGPPSARGTGLRRRVPQTHLVEQLRLDSGPDAASAPNGGPHTVREAADALTRYQAARATASRDGHR
jgi:hypothetical protein